MAGMIDKVKEKHGDVMRPVFISCDPARDTPEVVKVCRFIADQPGPVTPLLIPEPADAADPEAWRSDALFLPASRAAFRAILAEGYTDGVRACDPRDGLYTFWDYQAGSWQRNFGIRIDHLLLSPQACDRLVSASVQKHLRGLDKPSDHVPVTVELSAG